MGRCLLGEMDGGPALDAPRGFTGLRIKVELKTCTLLGLPMASLPRAQVLVGKIRSPGQVLRVAL